MSCIFCNPDRPIVVQNELAYAIRDGFPVSPGHTLVMPRRHAATVLDLTGDELAACFSLVRLLVVLLEDELHPNGFNIGMNCGEAAGQTVMHAHIHVIPRFAGDVPNPRGGVRHVIPGKGSYWSIKCAWPSCGGSSQPTNAGGWASRAVSASRVTSSR